jgi:hypothetical protein
MLRDFGPQRNPASAQTSKPQATLTPAMLPAKSKAGFLPWNSDEMTSEKPQKAFRKVLDPGFTYTETSATGTCVCNTSAKAKSVAKSCVYAGMARGKCSRVMLTTSAPTPFLQIRWPKCAAQSCCSVDRGRAAVLRYCSCSFLVTILISPSEYGISRPQSRQQT